MKAVKTVSILCCAVIFSVLLTNGVSAQIKEVPGQTKTTESQMSSDQSVKPDANKVPDEKSVGTNINNERYRFGFQDTVSIEVYKHPDLNKVVNVNPNGTISLWRIDQPVVAVCKTEQELSSTIENLYKTFLRNPSVTVRAVEQKSQQFAVMGAVEKPNNFYLSQRIQLLGLLALAGGPSVEKAGSEVRIARIGNNSACDENLNPAGADKKVQYISYNLRDVQDGKQNPWMQPGDVVTVLDAEEAYVIGNVVKPTKISLKEPKTLTQAIAGAYGVNSTAKTDKVIIQRQEAGSLIKTELVFDLKDIRSKKVPDPQLQANDIVEVGNDNMKSVRSGLVKALTGGISNVFLRVPLP